VATGGAPDRSGRSVVLRDGSLANLRPIRPGDEDRIRAFFHRLSPRTVYLRFHQVLKEMSTEDVHRFCNVDCDNSFALVATVVSAGEEKILAVGRYARLPGTNTLRLPLQSRIPIRGRGWGNIRCTTWQ
jgi:hypothetical protein